MAFVSDRFADRTAAGKKLAAALADYAGQSDLIVLALPRGGIPVACEVARELQAPLDLWLVRKLGAPGHEELAMGAIAAKNISVLNDDVIHSLNISKKALSDTIAEEKKELERRNQVYRHGKPPPDVKGKIAIVVDDGLATGATIRAAAVSLRKAGAARVVAAAPVGTQDVCHELEKYADDVVCVYMPEPFYGVAMWYDAFPQLSDQDVIHKLAAWETEVSGGPPDDALVPVLRHSIIPLTEDMQGYQPLIDAAEGKAFVLIGEATHGTAEFYRMRTDITRRLIVEKGFDAVAIEGDWPDVYRVNRYALHRSHDMNADQALSDFRRFPAWLWRNDEVEDFVEWLRDANVQKKNPAGFYGLDLYSMTSSIGAIVDYLQKVDPAAAAMARERYGCFGQFINDPQSYGYAIAAGVWDACEQEVVDQLMDLQRKARMYIEHGDDIMDEEYFSAWQNARLVRNAENYYRALFRGRTNTWNLRDQHMFETLEQLSEYYTRIRGRQARIVVWAHNSHLGNAAATDMALRDEINLGQLVSKKHGQDVLRIGFSTSHGTVTAASAWDGPAEQKDLRPPLEGSYEELFSRLRTPRFLLDLRDPAARLMQKRLERFIGVIYHPETERLSHYFHADMPEQFDFMIYIDRTTALTPLPHRTTILHGGVLDETYPSGL